MYHRGVLRGFQEPLLKMGLASYYVKDCEITVCTIASHSLNNKANKSLVVNSQFPSLFNVCALKFKQIMG